MLILILVLFDSYKNLIWKILKYKNLFYFNINIKIGIILKNCFRYENVIWIYISIFYVMLVMMNCLFFKYVLVNIVYMKVDIVLNECDVFSGGF